jgi:hypothetical protein
MMRCEILNPLIPRTPKISRETSEKFYESYFFRKTHFCRNGAKLLHARKIWKTTNYHLKLIISATFEHYCTELLIFFNINMIFTGFHRLFSLSRVLWACNNFARRLQQRFFRKKSLLENCYFSLVSQSILDVLGINRIKISQRIIFLIDLHMNSHF